MTVPASGVSVAAEQVRWYRLQGMSLREAAEHFAAAEPTAPLAISWDDLTQIIAATWLEMRQGAPHPAPMDLPP